MKNHKLKQLSKGFKEKTANMWTSAILTCSEFIGELSKIDAQRYFLQIVREICCHRCVSHDVSPSPDFPIQLQQNDLKLTLKISCSGMYFFVPDCFDGTSPEEECTRTLLCAIMIVDFTRLGFCELQDDVLYIKAIMNGEIKEFHLESVHQGQNIKDVVDHHVPKLEREAILSKYLRTHGNLASIVSFTLNSRQTVRNTEK